MEPNWPIVTSICTVEDDDETFKRDTLHILNELADLHEKVKK